jgi:hypothetical protein
MRPHLPFLWVISPISQFCFTNLEVILPFLLVQNMLGNSPHRLRHPHQLTISWKTMWQESNRLNSIWDNSARRSFLITHITNLRTDYTNSGRYWLIVSLLNYKHCRLCECCRGFKLGVSERSCWLKDCLWYRPDNYTTKSRFPAMFPYILQINYIFLDNFKKFPKVHYVYGCCFIVRSHGHYVLLPVTINM